MCDVSQEDIIPSILSTSAREDNKFPGNTYNCPPPLTIAIRLHCELRVELSLTYDEGASKQMHGRLMKMRIDGTWVVAWVRVGDMAITIGKDDSWVLLVPQSPPLSPPGPLFLPEQYNIRRPESTTPLFSLPTHTTHNNSRPTKYCTLNWRNCRSSSILIRHYLFALYDSMEASSIDRLDSIWGWLKRTLEIIIRSKVDEYRGTTTSAPTHYYSGDDVLR